MYGIIDMKTRHEREEKKHTENNIKAAYGSLEPLEIAERQKKSTSHGRLYGEMQCHKTKL